MDHDHMHDNHMHHVMDTTTPMSGGHVHPTSLDPGHDHTAGGGHGEHGGNGPMEHMMSMAVRSLLIPIFLHKYNAKYATFVFKLNYFYYRVINGILNFSFTLDTLKQFYSIVGPLIQLVVWLDL